MRRTRRDIDADILEHARDGASKTRIMYQCNLSHRMLNNHLNTLLKKRHIRFNPHPYMYHATPKGLSWLIAYHTLLKLEK